MTWRDVFDCKITVGHIERFLPIVAMTGYEFFVWNGCIYLLIRKETLEYFRTELTVEDIE